MPHSAQLGTQLVWVLASLASWATKWLYFLTEPPGHPPTRPGQYKTGPTGLLFVEGKRLGIWKISGGCLDGVWKVSGRCLEGVWKVPEGV